MTVNPTGTFLSQESGGGVTGYLKSWIGGGGSQEATPHPDQKTTHTQDLKDGSTAAVHTAPESTVGMSAISNFASCSLQHKPTFVANQGPDLSSFSSVNNGVVRDLMPCALQHASNAFCSLQCQTH